MDRRVDHLTKEGLARRQGQRIIFARDLLNTLRRRELDETVAKLSTDTGLVHRPSVEGEHVSGVYRLRVMLSSGRFAMIDDGLGFRKHVPWRRALEQQLGEAGERRDDTGRRSGLDPRAQARIGYLSLWRRSVEGSVAEIQTETAPDFSVPCS